jgi:hypothetical protein
MPPQELPHLGVDYRIISKATRYELMVPPFVPEIDVRPKPEGLGTPWLLLPADIGYRIDSWAGDPPSRLDSNAERQVYIHAPNEGSYQKWRLLPDGEGYWQLINVATGFALDGTSQDIYTTRPNDGAYQRWAFIRWGSA